ncbi:MAG: hypothetical protein A7316_08010 [Candidatus Altiarchaeales archaeon WOR_SM1_86-2]|nr:MAG: hypothetical protein A7316_08010 [Candidatus Altiarchaeales archaeon WOR_SM1_86-2]ODS40164.1 MAG: hypothetical protein A7315_09360 [Candidatus Altiarchaeales archaeon WOR_SM1_79]
MRYWPVPNSYSKTVPVKGSPGSFWEDRGDRYHCGVDIYAPEGSDVCSVEDCKDIGIGVCTSSKDVRYWNTTHYILVKNKTGFVCKYAELGDVKVRAGEFVNASQLIASVGRVLNPDKINEESPEYVQKLKAIGNLSMLHFELYKKSSIIDERYDLGGSWFSNAKPKNLLDPGDYLNSIKS